MEQTLGAAHALFAERGYAAVTMDEIAAAIGVTKPLLYNYFGNKERLYLACMERAGDSLIKTIAEAVSETANPGDALGAGVRAFFSFLDTDRSAWAVLFDETLPHGGEVFDRVAAYRGQIVDLVSAAIIDPAIVTRSALQNAASISGLLLTTDAIIRELKEDKPEPAGAPGGGMY